MKDDLRNQEIKTRDWFKPFEIIQTSITGVKVNSNSYLLKDFNISNQITISGLNQEFVPKANDAIFLEITLLSNMSISGSGVKIKCEPVGTGTDVPSWSGYPDVVEVLPKDIVDISGNILHKYRNKQQKKAFVLLGYTTTGSLEIPDAILGTGLQYGKNKFKLVNCVNNNLVMMHFCRDGVPIAYPFEYPKVPISGNKII